MLTPFALSLCMALSCLRFCKHVEVEYLALDKRPDILLGCGPGDLSSSPTGVALILSAAQYYCRV